MFKYLSHIVMLVGFAAIAAACAGYATFAAADMVTKSSSESNARTLLIITAAFEWGAAAVALIEAFALIAFAEELLESRLGPLLVKMSNYVFFIILIVGAILSGIAASEISKGVSYGSNQDEYNYAMHSTLIAAITGGLYIAVYTAMHLYASYKHKNMDAYTGKALYATNYLTL